MIEKLAIIVPYRDREAHLAEFVPAIQSQLNKEQIPYDIIVVEQASNAPFNGGKLKNVGFVIAQDYQWVCFHDVDLLPIKNSDYSIPTMPTRLSSASSKTNYEMIDNKNLGGVILFLPNHFIEINGYNNDYWGWGFEDNDLTNRCLSNGFDIECRPTIYEHLPELIATGPDEHYEINKQNFFKHDYQGNGLNTLAFNIQYREQKPGYLRYFVDIGMPDKVDTGA